MNLTEIQYGLEAFIKRNDFQTLQEFKDKLETLQLKEFIEFVKFTEAKYCKNLVFQSEDFEIVLICWKPFQKTSHHYHPKNGCLMKVFEGELTEVKLSNQRDIINVYKKGDISFIRASEAHTIKNSKYHSISLHIYSPSGFYDVR